MLRLRLIRLSILIHDQMELRMVNAQIAQPHMRRDARPDYMRVEVEQLYPKFNLVHRQIRRLAGPLKPMNYQPVSFDRQMPPVETYLLQLTPPARRIFQN